VWKMNSVNSWDGTSQIIDWKSVNLWTGARFIAEISLSDRFEMSLK
jgi:hypothetical protein